ncbi:hypothetical protein C5167_046754 [Papaver somniferum]|uniref:Uncharacterized protein n=1 Tax=Papaver somniferum TaxID=3469 RepID=A0A4Y7LHH5_PAPSO|nr:hypothetical protein C5167_046754 [Papaver somniferum]
MARSEGELLGMLPRHAVYVNCARRNSRNLQMLEFASDDSSIPVRRSNCVNLKSKETHEIGVVCRSP